MSNKFWGTPKEKNPPLFFEVGKAKCQDKIKTNPPKKNSNRQIWEAGSREGRTIGKVTQTLSFGIKQKKRKKKKTKAGSTLILARRKPTRAVCSRWSYPIQAELSLVLGGVPVLPTFRGPSCGSSASDRWRVWLFTRLHRQRAEPGSSPHCPSETP